MLPGVPQRQPRAQIDPPTRMDLDAGRRQDVAAQIIEFIEKNAMPGKTRTKGKG